MPKLAAFVGHSFLQDDKFLIREFLDYFDLVKGMGIGFTWDHAEPAEPKELSEKVKRVIQGKNLFIGICTRRERSIENSKLASTFFRAGLKGKPEDFDWKASDWIIQEIGLAIGRGMELMILLEDGVRRPGGLQGDHE